MKLDSTEEKENLLKTQLLGVLSPKTKIPEKVQLVSAFTTFFLHCKGKAVLQSLKLTEVWLYCAVKSWMPNKVIKIKDNNVCS